MVTSGYGPRIDSAAARRAGLVVVILMAFMLRLGEIELALGGLDKMIWCVVWRRRKETRKEAGRNI